MCRSAVDHSIVEDVTATYSNRPVDEILMSPLFEATQPFNQKITDLLAGRNRAIKNGNLAKRKLIEAELIRLNPDLFSYLEVERFLDESAGAAS